MPLKFWFNIVFFLIFAVPLSIHLSEIGRYPPVFDDKLAYYLEHQAEYNTIIVGSSYVYTAIDPRILDSTLRKEGIDSSSFNLAYHGFTGHEIDETLRLVLKADREGHLKRAIIDIRPQITENRLALEGTKMNTWWRSFYQTREVLKSVWNESWSIKKKFLLSLSHIRLFAANYVPKGSGLILYENYAGNYETDWAKRDLPEFHGYDLLSVEKVVAQLAERRANAPYGVLWDMLQRNREMMGMSDELTKERERLADEAHELGDLTCISVEFWRQRSRSLREHGILAVYVLMPAYNNPFTASANSLAQEGALDYYVSFNDPDRFSNLFRLEHRFDFGHLDASGARIISRRLGSEIAALIKGEPSIIEVTATVP